MKTDPISIIVYIIIIFILYYCIGIIIKVIYWYLLIPPFSYFREYTFGTSNPAMIIPTLIWSVLYSTVAIVCITIIFVFILVVVFIIYIIWMILNKIPIFGPIILATVPPFRQFEEAGIFKLIDDMGEAVAKWLPKSFVKMLGRMFMILVRFTKDKIIDIAKLIKPELELKPSEIDAILDGMEGFANPEDAKNLHKIMSLEALEQRNLADRYRSLASITPDMSEQDRMSIIFDNEVKKMQIQFDNMNNNIKLETATLPK